MRNLFSKYRHLTSLVMVILFAVGLANLNVIQPVTAFFIVACWQLVQLAKSPRVGACFVIGATPAQIDDAVKIVKDFEAYTGLLKGIPDRVKGRDTARE